MYYLISNRYSISVRDVIKIYIIIIMSKQTQLFMSVYEFMSFFQNIISFFFVENKHEKNWTNLFVH